MLTKILVCLFIVFICYLICKTMSESPILRPLIIIVLACISAFLANILPDIDLLFRVIPYVKGFISQLLGLTHRSWITHSCIWVLIMMIITRLLFDHDIAVIVGLATALGLTYHLGFDLFPKSWHGTALITFPLWIGRIPIVGSYISIFWLGLNIILGFLIVGDAWRNRYKYA